MIDWWFVARNAVWILGASIVLICWSYSRSLDAEIPPESLSLRTASRFGAALFCLGFATISRWWEAIVWLILGALAVFPVVASLRTHRWKRQLP